MPSFASIQQASSDGDSTMTGSSHYHSTGLVRNNAGSHYDIIRPVRPPS